MFSRKSESPSASNNLVATVICIIVCHTCPVRFRRPHETRGRISGEKIILSVYRVNFRTSFGSVIFITFPDNITAQSYIGLVNITVSQKETCFLFFLNGVVKRVKQKIFHNFASLVFRCSARIVKFGSIKQNIHTRSTVIESDAFTDYRQYV